MKKILTQKFFNRDTRNVAKELLGKYLVRNIGDREISVMIAETEAYDGFHDKASHASKGKTARTEVMFGEPGIFYVYLCYGVYFMLNIVTREAHYPAAVLIRGGIGEDPDRRILDGPGKLTRFLFIDKNFNNKKAKRATGLWFEDRGVQIDEKNNQRTPRIGVSYAGSLWSAKKFRFVLKNSLTYLSRGPSLTYKL
ncbi:DNA-3-methyladenine glycosylase [Candidatus Uhrbacteria bacterium]|nr:DNA-3-methyladenine glycosylase [Candidatus Uhrbacteria bacterium]